jgi:hypothetical protein
MPGRPLRPPVKLKARRWKREAIPEQIRQGVIEFAQALAANHAANFAANLKLKHRVARLLLTELPPRRRPGRPGLPAVTRAAKMLDELRRLHPGKPSRDLWRRIYPAVIEGYDSMNKLERRDAARELCRRVGWRRRARRLALMRRINV